MKVLTIFSIVLVAVSCTAIRIEPEKAVRVQPRKDDIECLIIHASNISVSGKDRDEDIDDTVSLFATSIQKGGNTGSIDIDAVQRLAAAWGERSRSYDVVFARLLSSRYSSLLTDKVLSTVAGQIQKHPQLLAVVREERSFGVPLSRSRWTLRPQENWPGLTKGQKFYVLLVQSSLMDRPDWIMGVNLETVHNRFTAVQGTLKVLSNRIKFDPKSNRFVADNK